MVVSSRSSQTRSSLTIGLALLLLTAACGDSAGENTVLVRGVEYGPAPLSLHDAAHSSEAVVYGEVVAVRPGRVLDSPEDEPKTQVADVILDVRQVLAGSIDSKQIAIEMLGWEYEGDIDTPSREIVVDGVRVPTEGQEMVWFVNREEGSVDGADRYGLISFDGLFTVVDGKLSSTLMDSDRLGPQSSGTTLEELIKLINET